jgi:hypothetical protein
MAAAIEGIIDPQNADPIMKVVLQVESIKPRYGDSLMFNPVVTNYGDVNRTPKQQRFAHKVNYFFSFFPREGDRLAYFTVIHAKASELIENGYTTADAIAEGIKEADASQTTMNPARTPAFVAGIKQTSPIIANSLKLQTTVLQMLDRNMMQVDKVIKYWSTGQKKKAIDELADVLVRWNFWVPFSYMAASGTLSLGEAIRRTLTGPAGDVAVVGQIINALSTTPLITVLNAIPSDDEDRKKIQVPWFSGQDLVTSALDRARGNFVKSLKAMNGDGDDADIVKGLLYAAEGSAWIAALSTGFPIQELAKITNNVYNTFEDGFNADIGDNTALVASLMGYSEKKIEDLRKQLEEGE